MPSYTNSARDGTGLIRVVHSSYRCLKALRQPHHIAPDPAITVKIRLEVDEDEMAKHDPTGCLGLLFGSFLAGRVLR